jgi:hypothetical protein
MARGILLRSHCQINTFQLWKSDKKIIIWLRINKKCFLSKKLRIQFHWDKLMKLHSQAIIDLFSLLRFTRSYSTNFWYVIIHSINHFLGIVKKLHNSNKYLNSSSYRRCNPFVNNPSGIEKLRISVVLGYNMLQKVYKYRSW